jgi:DNA-binding CsgD family transcriptional regulator/tetratricopeptide (TPR) repeat protein/type II secretory pathway predicted ATPase ExeA
VARTSCKEGRSLHNAATRSWPLVGRGEELVLCDRMLADSGLGVVIAGAAGVGKTRLATEVLEAASREGCHVVRVAATEAARSIPFGAVAHLLPDALPSGAAQIDLLRVARAAVAASAAGRRIVVGVDDAHLLDAASATLVHQLAARREAALVVTVRTGEASPDAVTALWKDEGCAYVELQPLAEGELGTLLELALGPTDGPTVHALWGATRGIPLFVRELVRHGLERGLLTERHGIWHWRGPLVPGRRLRDLVEVRIGDLTAAQRELLAAVALGEPLGRSFFDGRAEEASNALIRRGVVEPVHEGRRLSLRAAHPLYAEAARASVPALRASSLRREIADAVQATGARRREDVLRLVVWRLDAGDAGDADLLLRAAQQAAMSFDPALAERLARAAVDAGAGPTALNLLGSSLTAVFRFAEAEELLAKAELESRTDGELAAAAVARARNLMAGLGRPDEALDIVAAADVRVQDPAARLELIAARGFVEFRLGRVGEAARTFRRLLVLPDADVRTRVHGAGQVAFAMALAGRPKEGLDVLGRWRKQAELPDEGLWSRPGAARPLGSYLTGRSLCLAIGGQLAEAEAAASTYYELAVVAGDPSEAGLAVTITGLIMCLEGRVRSGLRRLREASVLLDESDPTGARPWPFAFAAQAAAQAGDTAGARGALASAEIVGWRAPLQESSILLARSWVAAAEGALTNARRFAADAGVLAERLGQLGPAMMAWHDLARLGGAQPAAERLVHLAERTDGDLLPVFADHSLALLQGDGGALDAVAARFRDLGAMLYAAEASAAAAAAHAGAGRAASSRAAAARSSAARERCEGAVTPALAHAGTAELTRREREIAALAATGLSSSEIAGRLFLSVRTVDNHLSHIYRKLGVTGRAELADVL